MWASVEWSCFVCVLVNVEVSFLMDVLNAEGRLSLLLRAASSFFTCFSQFSFLSSNLSALLDPADSSSLYMEKINILSNKQCWKYHVLKKIKSKYFQMCRIIWISRNLNRINLVNKTLYYINQKSVLYKILFIDKELAIRQTNTQRKFTNR